MANPFEDPDTALRELRKQAEDLETKAAQLRTELARATTTTTSPDGAVTVTLSPTGALENIVFSAKAASHSPEALGPLVMNTVRAAQREVSSRVTASLTEQFGDQDTADFIAQFMPQPEPEPKRPDEDLGGTVLRKRQGRPRARHDDDGGGSLLR